MSFGRKIETRILLSYLAPLAVMLTVSTWLVSWIGPRFHPVTYAFVHLFCLLPALFVGRVFTRRIFVRLALVLRGARQIEQGERAGRLESGDDDEFGDLARAFNHMADVLMARESALREQNQALAGLNRRFESVLNAANDGIAMLDRDGRFVLVNRRFGEILGTGRETLDRQTLADIRPVLTARLAPAQRLPDGLASDGANAGVGEDLLELAEPEQRTLQVYTAPVTGEDGQELIGRIIALRDVTRERELDKMKTDFISVVSHELRTPLTSIRGYTELLLGGATGEINELQSEFLEIIQGSTTRLSNLINDILDISRIESGRIVIKHEPIDYRRIVADVLTMLRQSADAKQIVMDAHLPEAMPPVRGDSDKITQVLTNLVSNAVKYTPPGGRVDVTLERGENSVTTCVADSGIGIAPDDQKKLFQRFFRADNTSTREAGGTGLGLVIAKTLVELLGGAIWIESETGKGSKFFFTLPLQHETDSSGLTAPVPLPDRGIGLVLVVDDDSYVRGLLQHALHRRGYGTLIAGDEADAQRKARLHKPDAITLDIMMPDMEGFALLRALRQDPATAHIPILIFSVVGDPARGGLSLGAFSFLQKPLDPDRLAETISASLVSARGSLPPPQQRPWASALFVGPSPNAPDFASLNDQGIAVQCVETPADALSRVIVSAPDVVLLDMAALNDAFFSLVLALKAEEEAARIPIVLLTDDIPDEGIHFHLGCDAGDNVVSLDYICEQLARALRQPVGSVK